MTARLIEGEHTIALTRQHWSTVVPALVAGALVLIAGIVVLILIPASVGGANVGGIKLAVGIALAVVVLIWSLVHYLRWRMATYLLTDHRIVVERGVLSRFSESITLDRIQNTEMRRPLGDRLIGAGDIAIESAGRDGEEILHRIPRAEQFYNEIMQAMDALRSGGQYNSRGAGGA